METESLTTGEPEEQRPVLPFHSISFLKFVLLTVATFGIYEIWWFYEHWRQVRNTTGARLTPVARAIFSPVFCYSLFKRVKDNLEEQTLHSRFSPGLLSVGYIALLMTQRLPDPYWLISFLSILPLLIMQAGVNRLHYQIDPGYDRNGRFGLGGGVLLVLGGIIWFFFVIVMLMPETGVISGDALSDSDRQILLDEGYLLDNEKVLSFYSSGLWSIREDGNLLTDERVVSYEVQGGEKYFAAVPYTEIADIEVTFSQSWFEDTQIVVTTNDGEDIYLIVSPEEGGDRAFVGLLRAQWKYRQEDPEGSKQESESVNPVEQ